MGKIAVVFPGQGAQKVGTVSDLYSEEERSTQVLDLAQETVDFDLPEMMFTDSDGKLGETEDTQSALLAHSVALLESLNHLKIDYIMGHSLGEYSSLVASDILPFGDAIRTVHKHGQLMARVFPNDAGGMAEVLGLGYDNVDKICQILSTKEQLIESANTNSPGQIVVSGHKSLIDELVKKGKELGAKRVLPLAVSGPSYSSMMKVIEKDFANFTNQFEWHNANYPVVQDVNAKGEADAEAIEHNVVEQLYSPVQLIRSAKQLINQGVDYFVEVGPRKVLSELIKRINRDVKTTSIQTLEDVKGWSNHE